MLSVECQRTVHGVTDLRTLFIAGERFDVLPREPGITVSVTYAQLVREHERLVQLLGTTGTRRVSCIVDLLREERKRERERDGLTVSVRAGPFVARHRLRG